MDVLDLFDRPVASYEGRIAVGALEEGYFEAIQASDGKLRIACFWPHRVAHLQTGRITTSINAWAKGGWALDVEGDTFCQNLNIRTIHGHAMTYATLIPSKLHASQIPEHMKKVDYLVTRFAIVNLLLGSNRNRMPDSVKFAVEGCQVTIKPVEAYPERSEVLRAVSGIEHTAFVEIRLANGRGQSLNDAADFMNVLVAALRLWSGNKLDWLYGAGLDDSGNEEFERIHKNSVTGRFSNNLSHIGWEINLEQLVESFFSDDQLLDRQTTRELVDYFVDACATGHFLATRALSLATLLDTMTLKLVRDLEQHEILPESEFIQEILPKLKETIDGTSLSEGTKIQLKNNLRGLFRTSFSRRLTALSTKLNLGMNSSFRDRVKTTRDLLVHEGRFPEGDRGRWLSDYHRLLWTDAAILCRIAGYKGDLTDKP